MKTYPTLAWRPHIEATTEWIIDHLRAYLGGKHFALFKYGSCVVWESSEEYCDAECRERLLSVVTHYPDFKVRRHSSGDFLVTFRGGVGGLMSGKLLEEHFVSLREDALTIGKLKSETLHSAGQIDADEVELVAGIYVRAQLYRDAEESVIVARV
ncbi:hypothetical protein PO883_25950 [Massilia sp. DJPM01]|uniref:hypothetical protein n=1 Tax=Massilia sp. DJPM01 TaxID=3024404 RepID=UPI00259E8340|nr:hypothetical protein [Massilia sp. DJPM01]MDM5180630.1 hypothetical protein [Massilia sp. DJPM01]